MAELKMSSECQHRVSVELDHHWFWWPTMGPQRRTGPTGRGTRLSSPATNPTKERNKRCKKLLMA